MIKRAAILAFLGVVFLSSCSIQKSGNLVERIRAGYYPYKVMKHVRPGYTEFGSASWYGKDFHGRLAASGEVYNMYAKTAAHKTLPFGTYVKVINLNNHRETVVRINDRGPFVKNRIIDLSYAAAKDLGMIGTGTAPVEIVVLDSKKIQKTKPLNIINQSENIHVLSNNETDKNSLSSTIDEVKHYSMPIYAVQLASFRSLANALKFRREASKKVKGVYIKKVMFSGIVFYRVMVGSFSSKEEANRFAYKAIAPIFSSFCISLR